MRALLLLVAVSLSGCVTYHQVSLPSDYEQGLPPEASMNGKYRDLMLTFEAPEDVGEYGVHYEYGYWDLESYKGYGPIPPGYWVYVEPLWYVWEKQISQ